MYKHWQNLKKSWHPSTFQNLEKVWKAEQRHDQEKKKIEQLQQEIREERTREDMHKAAVDSGLIRLAIRAWEAIFSIRFVLYLENEKRE